MLCVGNPLRGDDGLGGAVAARLKGRTGAAVLDAGAAPENFTGALRRLRPEVLLVVDAADFGGRPGQARLLSPAELDAGGVSSHAAGLGLLAGYLAAECGAETIVLAVQAGRVGTGTEMSPEAADAARSVAEGLIGVLGPCTSSP